MSKPTKGKKTSKLTPDQSAQAASDLFWLRRYAAAASSLTALRQETHFLRRIIFRRLEHQTTLRTINEHALQRIAQMDDAAAMKQLAGTTLKLTRELEADSVNQG